VLLTNGWDTSLREQTAEHFKINPHELQKRHEMVFEDFERGKLSFQEYLHHTVFYAPRSFSYEEFTDFIFNASSAYPEMIQMVIDLKERFKLKVGLLSNEGKEIAVSRFEKFNFKAFVDYYIVSGFVGYRKPDLRIYELALGLCQSRPERVVYIDDRLPFIE